MGYWQDVLAENPGILKPTLNNTGPFRRFLHDAFLDNTAVDRFATELIRMEGSALGGGPAGFGIASQNDAPMAAKAHVLAKAFLAAEMKCARCHDAPFHPYDQADLFGLAGAARGQAAGDPGDQHRPAARPAAGSRRSRSRSRRGRRSSPPGTSPRSPRPSCPTGSLPAEASPRERLAALITSPTNRRFAPVVVNRLWQRYLGSGLVEPVDDWDDSPSTPPPRAARRPGPRAGRRTTTT